MSHYIAAKMPGVDAAEVRREIGLDDFDFNDDSDAWHRTYEEYINRTELVYVSRAAGNPLNQVLYLALGAMDEAYAGCSGNGIEIAYTLQEFRDALEILTKKEFTAMTREKNEVDQLLGMFSNAGITVVGGTTSDDVWTEVRFLMTCIAYLEAYPDVETITVQFG